MNLYVVQEANEEILQEDKRRAKIEATSIASIELSKTIGLRIKIQTQLKLMLQGKCSDSSDSNSFSTAKTGVILVPTRAHAQNSWNMLRNFEANFSTI